MNSEIGAKTCELEGNLLRSLRHASLPLLEEVTRIAGKLLELRKEEAVLFDSASHPALTVPEALPARHGGSNGIVRLARPRSPMRPPQPGSTRELVYTVLANGAPVSRAEIIRGVAALRGTTADDRLDRVVHTILTDRHDTRLRRVQRGYYCLLPMTASKGPAEGTLHGQDIQVPA